MGRFMQSLFPLHIFTLVLSARWVRVRGLRGTSMQLQLAISIFGATEPDFIEQSHKNMEPWYSEEIKQKRKRAGKTLKCQFLGYLIYVLLTHLVYYASFLRKGGSFCKDFTCSPASSLLE